jgi:hypothetical protein
LSRIAGPHRRVYPFAAPFSARVRKVVTVTVLGGLTAAVLGLAARLILPPPSPFVGRAVVTDLANLLPQARGEVVQNGRTRACAPYNGVKIRCPAKEWNYAGEVVMMADHLMRQCIWLHPIQNAQFTLHFDQVPLGETLQGNFGLDDSAVESPGGHPVLFSVSLDGLLQGTFSCAAKRGWYDWEVPTPGRTGTVGRVTVQSEAHVVNTRQFCFTAYTTR